MKNSSSKSSIHQMIGIKPTTFRLRLRCLPNWSIEDLIQFNSNIFSSDIFSTPHRFSCQNFRVTRCAILIFSAFSIFSSDTFSPNNWKYWNWTVIWATLYFEQNKLPWLLPIINSTRGENFRKIELVLTSF